MKRKIALALTMAMLGTCLAGCGQADTDTNASTEAKDTTAAAGTAAAETTESEKEWYGTEDGKTITLHFWGGVQPEYGYDDLCANFNEEYKDKGLQVEYVRYVNDDNGNLQLETYLMGGGDVDLFIGYGGRTKMDKRVDSNLLLDMSGMLNDIGFNLDDELGVANMAEYHYDDGAVYGFPTKYENSRWILINEDMFKEAGLDIPYDGWTYSEFLADAEKLTHGEGQDKVYGVCWARKQSGKSILYALDGVLGANQIYKNEEGTEVTLTATGNDIIDFNNWSNGETTAEIKTTMNADQAFTATFSAKDYIVAWDFYQEGKEGRTADFAAADNDAVQLVLRDAEGNSYGWLDKSNTAGGYEGKNAAVNWTKTTTKALGETYWQTKFNATAFTDIKVKSSMLYNYNAYETYNVEYSLDGEKWTQVGAIAIPGAKAWTAGEFTLPADANNKAEVYIRWIADKTSSIKGATGNNDGISITDIYITGTAQLVNDGKAPVLVSTVPAKGATNASANGKIVLTFDEKVKLTASAKATLNAQELTGAVSGKTITFAYKGLSYATAYTFTLVANSVADLTDNAIENDITYSFTTKEKPAVTKAMYDFIVPTDGDFKAALAAAAKRTDTSKRFRIFIKQGDYKIPADENKMVEGNDGKQYPSATTYLNTPNVSIIGESNENTSITNTVPAVECDKGFGMANVLEGIGKGDVLSLESGAVNTYFQDIKMYSSMGDKKGRDIVLNDKSNKTICKNVNLWAYQDTYVSNNQKGRFYFEGGILRGNTDFLCGKGDVYYNNVDLLMCGTGYLAVPSLPTQYGYIFKDCTIKDGSDTGINGKYKLGRPWGKGTPIALFIDTKMEVIPTAAGWDEMSGGYPKRFAEYNSTTTTGTAVDLSGRKQVYDAYDAKDGNNYTNHRNETAESPVLTAEEAAFYTLETVMGGDDDWDPTAATEQASAPTNVKIAGNNLTWDNSNYTLLWAVCKDGKVVAFTVEPTYNVDDASATWSVRAANEMGGLGEATEATTSTGIENITTSSDVLSTKIYSADGVQVSKLQRGINIVVKTMTDGSKKTNKVVLK